MRRSYIDNLRIICILLLFPFHSAMCFNTFGERFYVTGEPTLPLTLIVVGVFPWWMSLLFVLAGISTVYALKKRSAAEYAKERVQRLLIPLIAGLLLLIPPQAFIADTWYNDYNGSLPERYVKFFTNITDLLGSDGCFTPGNLWFILYLLIISLITLPVTIRYAKRENKPDFGKINIFALIFGGFILITAATFIGDIGGKSIGDYAACFLLGFFILSDDNMQKKLQRYAFPLGIAWAALIAFRCAAYGLDIQLDDLVWDLEYKLLEWTGILAALGLGGRFLDKGSGFTRVLAPAAFPLYVLHQTVLVAAAYFLVPLIGNTYCAFAAIVLTSFILTFAAYEVFRRIKVTGFLLGIKSKRSADNEKNT